MTELKAAVEAGNLDEVLLLLQQSEVVDEKPNPLFGAFSAAIAANNDAILDPLLLEGRVQGLLCDRTFRQFIASTLTSASTCSVAVMKLLVNAGFDPLQEISNCLAWVASKCSIEMLEYVWEMAASRGYNIDSPDRKGQTALHRACETHNLLAVQFLIEHGASVNAADQYGDTPLMVFSRREYDVEENYDDIKKTIQAFLDAGVDLNEVRSSNWGPNLPCTPLMVAASAGNIEIMRALLAAGADIERIQSRFRKTALHFAVESGRVNSAMFLIKAGANVHALDRFNNTPLHLLHPDLAHPDDIIKLISELLERGVELDALNTAGNTALLCACEEITKDCVAPWPHEHDRLTVVYSAVEALIQSGANINALGDWGHLCLHALVRGTYEHCLFTWDSLESVYIVAGAAQKLLKAGVKATVRDVGGHTALQNLKYNVLDPEAEMEEEEEGDVQTDYKTLSTPIIATLIEGGDVHSWDVVPEDISLGRCILSVWNHAPEELPNLFKKLPAADQERVRVALLYLKRFINVQEVELQILSYALDV